MAKEKACTLKNKTTLKNETGMKMKPNILWLEGTKQMITQDEKIEQEEEEIPNNK
jgi:hypothetical protein